ncbi:MarR family transcriptional regulator [Paenibacillus sp. 1P03SA]|uniref:MarR family transcriptional regulator n=1 Tax=Paenibacillus sp. 1P03SA TaxID=3132294 RepID=UPI0039A2E46F
MRKLSTRIVLFQQNAAHSLGFIHTDLKTADILNEKGPVTAGELARLTGLTTGTVTALIDRLEQAGFVRREKDPQDGRRVIIVPVKEKQNEIGALYRPLGNRTRELCQEYTADQLDLINTFLSRMVGVFEQANGSVSVTKQESCSCKKSGSGGNESP